MEEAEEEGREEVTGDSKGDVDLGGNNGGGTRGTPAVVESRATDWSCSFCQFHPNFGRRNTCYQCGRQRGSGAVAGERNGHGGGEAQHARGGGTATGGARPANVWPQRESSALGRSLSSPGPHASGLRPQAAHLGIGKPAFGGGGPVGADGRRPLLSRPGEPLSPLSATAGPRGQATGASAGAGGRQAAPGRNEDGGGSAGGGTKRPVAATDADGFTKVMRGTRWSQAASAARADKTEGDASADSTKLTGSAAAEGPAAMDVAEDGPGADGGGGDMGDGGGDPQGGDGQGAPEPLGPEELKTAYEKEKELLALLRRQGRDEDDPLVHEVTQRCEDARALWEGTKKPAPLHRKLRKVEEALAKARKRQEAIEESLENLEAEFYARRQDLCHQLEEAKARRSERQEELDDVLRKVGPSEAGSGKPPAREELRKVARRIDDVAPNLQAALEAMPTGSAQYAALAEAIAKLQGVSLEAAGAEEEEERDEGTHWWDAHGGQGAYDHHYYGWDQGADDDMVQETHGSWARDEWDHHGDGWGGAAWSQQQWPQQGTGQANGRQASGAAAGTGILDGREAVFTGSAGNFASDEERERAKRAYELQAAAVAATQGAGFASPNAAAAAASVHADKLASVKRAAADKGVEYEDAHLDGLAPEALSQWEETHL